eukprot:XP_016659886.1 PREDICTED: nose resistant to fluoxetine protein 6-like [Acyrthosiphon pisum]
MQSATVLVSILAIVSAESEYQPQRWVTRILHDTLESYVPDGGPSCRRDGQTYREGLKDLKLWATQMYDASAKFPTGILSGKSVDFGDYDECMETNTNSLDFKPQYCIVNIRFSPSVKLYPNYYKTTPLNILNSSISAWEAVKLNPNPAKVQRNEINTAICIPSSCTHSDLQSTLSQNIISAFNEEEINTTVTVDPLFCTTQHDKPPKTLGFIIFWCFILVIVILTIVGTLQDLYSKEDTESKCKPILVAFSIQSNLKKLFYNSTKTAEFAGCNFLKIIACLVVLLGHRLMYISAQPIYNTNKIEETFEMMIYGVVHNGPLVVDIFLTICGFLTFVNMYSELVKTKQFNMPFILFWRWCRLIPLYGVMIAFYSFVLIHLSDGPLWRHMAVKESENCQQNWWTNLLFVNNYVNADQPCMIQSWYMACDLHLCAVGILIVYFVWKFPKCEKIVLIIAIVVSCFISAYVVYDHKFYPTFFGFISNLKYPPSHEDFTLLYIPTHTRATPYFVGMFAGHVYRTTRARKPDFRFPYPTLCLWTIVGGCVLWMMSVFYFFVHEYSMWASVLYALVFRLIYSAMISAFIIISAVNTCYTGSWTLILAPLGRLTYGVYMGGLSIQLFYVASARTQIYFNQLLISWVVIGDSIFGFIIAFILYMLIESPFENLLKLFINKIKGGKNKTEERTPNAVEMISPHTGHAIEINS